MPELYAREGERVWYTALNDVAVIDFRAKQLNFFDFQQESGMASYAMDEQIPISKVREALYKHAKKPKPENRQNHFEDVVIQKAVKDTLIKDYINVVGAADSKTITLKETQKLFFDLYPEVSSQEQKPQNPNHAPFQSKLLVNINSVIVNMQLYVLESIRNGLKSGQLSRDVYDTKIDGVYSSDDIFMTQSEGAQLFRDTTDVCMVRPHDCLIDSYHFYLFKQMNEKHNDYANEML